MKIIKISIIALISTFSVQSALACTTVFQNNPAHPQVVARTLDLYTSDFPTIIVEPRGQVHTGDAGENSLQWKSKYGSLVVTAFHSNAVSDGLNEKGLAVHLLYLSGTEYSTADKSKPQIANAKWSQYLLDNFSTVDEALKGSADLQIVATKIYGRTWPLHLTMEDKTGDSAVIEFLKGKMHIYHGHQYTIMTNEPAYDIQLSNLKLYQGFGGKLSLPGDPDPLSRFVRVATYIKTLPVPKTQIESIAGVLSVIRTAMTPFGALDTSASGTEDAWATFWVSIADMTNGVYYFNSTTAPNIIWLDLKKMNFTAGAQRLSIDPTDIHLEGDVTSKLTALQPA
jgi:penicillin V acylase-like amidase (Ntn superfamily)